MYSLITYRVYDFIKDTQIPKGKSSWKTFEIVPEAEYSRMYAVLTVLPATPWQWGVPLRMWGPVMTRSHNSRHQYFEAVREVLCFDVSAPNYPIRIRKPFIWEDVPMYLRRAKRKIIG